MNIEKEKAPPEWMDFKTPLSDLVRHLDIGEMVRVDKSYQGSAYQVGRNLGMILRTKSLDGGQLAVYRVG